MFSTRQLAHVVFKDIEIKNEETCEIDFEGVETVTPSFMHEMLIIFANKKIEPSIENMNDSVAFQLKKAEKAMIMPTESNHLV